MNAFTQIPDRARKVLYLVFSFINLGILSVGAWAAAMQITVPHWTSGVAAVLATLGTAFGWTAASNITPAPKPPTE